MTSVIPYRVEFRIKVEELGRLTQGFGSVVFGFLLLQSDFCLSYQKARDGCKSVMK